MRPFKTFKIGIFKTVSKLKSYDTVLLLIIKISLIIIKFLADCNKSLANLQKLPQIYLKTPRKPNKSL